MRLSPNRRVPVTVAGLAVIALISSACAVDQPALEVPDVTAPSTTAATTTTSKPEAVTTTEPEAVTTTQPKSLPALGEVEATSTELNTASGPVTITHLKGDESSLPGWFPQRSGEGFVVLEEPGHGSGGVRLWRSNDGVDWYLDHLGMTVDAEGADLFATADGYWLSTFDPSGLYFSEDLKSWVSLDMTSLAQGPIEGFHWQAHALPAVTTSGKTFVGVWLWGQPMWDQILGFDPTTYDQVRAWPAFEGDGEAVYIVSGETDGETEEIGRLAMEAAGSEVRIADSRSGDMLAVLDTGASSLSAAALLGGVTHVRTTRLGIVDWPTHTVELVDTPWGDDVQEIQVVATPGGATVSVSTFAGADRALSFQQYSTSDGVDWIGPSRPSFLQTDELDDVSVSYRNGALLMSVRRGPDARFYTSDDGIDWDSFDVPYPDAEVVPFELGFATWDHRNRISVSRDGLQWDEVDTSSISADDPEGAGIGFTTAVGDTIFMVAASDSGPRDMWVVQFAG